MRILLVWPTSPKTFWSMENALKFISKKCSEPPLGLLTVAALLPVAWEKKLVDMNVSSLKDDDIRWADYVFVGGMDIQEKSFRSVVSHCKELGTRVVAGGPMCTSRHEQFEEVDHFVLNEAEITLPLFLSDLQKGDPQRVYTTDQFADMTTTPLPLWHLLKMDKYATMDVQYSRGCPHDCEFCSITYLYGHRPRTKDSEQFLRELESLYLAGWRGPVFIVDDNFVGNRRKLKTELLPAMIQWAESRGRPFAMSTEVTIDLSDDETLMQLMAEAGFDMVFVGIETPDDGSLGECNKLQNRGRDLVESVQTLQRQGFEVTAGFIVGFDHDQLDIFDRQIRFIQTSGIVSAMVGLLNAPIGTRLFDRLRAENRLQGLSTGNNVEANLNFVPKMGINPLIVGYRNILRTIYSPKAYFERMKTFLQKYRVPTFGPRRLTAQDISAFFRAVWRLGFVEEGKRFFWRLLFWVLHNAPEKLPRAMSLAIRGLHYRRVAEVL